ncbi:MAG: flagellar hook-basal body complex protein FliE [bacterium]
MSIGPLGDINSFINMKKFDPMNEVNALSKGNFQGKIENNPASLQNYINNAFNNNQNAFINDGQLQDDLKALTSKSPTLQGGVQFNQPDNNISTPSIDGLDGMSPGKAANAFSNILNNHLANTTKMQNEADNLTERFAAGDKIDVHTVMIAAEKASTSMQFTMQLRNKMLQAYQEVSRMQI